MSDGQQWKLFLKGVGGNTTIYRMPPDCNVDLLFERIQEYTDIEANELKIIFAGRQLVYNCGKHLSDYKIGNLSTLFMVFRLKVGWFPTKTQNQQLKPLYPFITLTTEKDILTLDDDPSYKRARMPCGHAIGSATMTGYCRSVLDQGNFRFYCPYINPKTHVQCQREWDYFMVKHVAMMDVDSLKEFEAKVSENYLLKQGGIKKCPGCNTYCERPDKPSMKVRCQICSLSGGPSVEFCWSCLHTWCGNKDHCQNKECDGRDPRLKYLSACGEKEVVGVKSPSVRACPNCGTLINHTGAGKYMACPGCKQQFCFICLNLQRNGRWICGNNNTPCKVAPTQTEITGFEETQMIEIFIRKITGIDTSYKVAADCIVRDLRKRIAAKNEICEKEVRLLYRGQQLESDRRLSYYGIRDQSMVHFILRLSGS